MFPARYFPPRYFPPRYFPEHGAAALAGPARLLPAINASPRDLHIIDGAARELRSLP